MKAELLLRHFEKLADSPDAIIRLRRFILNLAVMGKLLEQDPAEAPVESLIAEIQAKRLQLAQKDPTLKTRLYEQPREGRFPLPNHWRWAKLGFLTNVVMGQSPPGSSYNRHGEGLPLINGPVEFSEGPFGVTVRNQYTTEPTKMCKKGDLLLCVRGSTTGRTNIAGFDACIGRGVAAIQSLYPDRFVRLFIWSSREHIISMGRGIAFPSISLQQVEELPVPLPPLAEQQRIAAKIDQLTTLLDEIESAQVKCASRRSRLVSAALHSLEDGGATAARFYFNHLPRLTTRPEHIQQLRQTILNLAVRGKLVPQDATDVPVSTLLQELKIRRKRVSESLDMRNSSLTNDTEPSEPPFAIPSGWRWVTVDECFVVTGGIQKTPKRTPVKNAFPYLGVANVYRGRIDLSEVKEFELENGELQRYRLESNDLLVVEGNGSASEVGRCARWAGELADCVHQNHIIRCRPGLPHLSPFIELYLNSPVGIDVMKRPVSIAECKFAADSSGRV